MHDSVSGFDYVKYRPLNFMRDLILEAQLRKNYERGDRTMEVMDFEITKESIHRVAFEMLDRELRKVPADQIKKINVTDELTKELYPLTPNVRRWLKNWALGDSFFYAHPGKFEVHFNVQNEDEPDGTISVIVMR